MSPTTVVRGTRVEICLYIEWEIQKILVHVLCSVIKKKKNVRVITRSYPFVCSGIIIIYYNCFANWWCEKPRASPNVDALILKKHISASDTIRIGIYLINPIKNMSFIHENVSDKFVLKIQTRPSGIIIHNRIQDLLSRRREQ